MAQDQVDSKFLTAYPKPPKKSIFLFHCLVQSVIHGLKALVLWIPEHFLFFLWNNFWPSYEQKRNAKNVENLPKSSVSGLKSTQMIYVTKVFLSIISSYLKHIIAKEIFERTKNKWPL